MSKKKTKDERKRDTKLDEALEMTYPASDPIAAGHPTGTEPTGRSADHKAPITSKDK